MRKIKAFFLSRSGPSVVVAGVVSGAAFVILFVRVPRWMGPTAPYVYLALLFLFVYAGGWLADRLYRRYGCPLGLHGWEEHRLPRFRECRVCGLHQRLIDPFEENSGWEDVNLVFDQVTGVYSFEDVPVGEMHTRGVGLARTPFQKGEMKCK